MDETPVDPFAGDPDDPAAALSAPTDDAAPLEPGEREELLEQLADLATFRALLEPAAVRGIVVDCDDCSEPHYFDWELLQANVRSLLDTGLPRMHEPAFSPNPDDYVSWDYARGYADGVLSMSDDD